MPTNTVINATSTALSLSITSLHGLLYFTTRYLAATRTQSREGIRKSADTFHEYVACVVGDVRNFINTVVSSDYHDCIDQV